MSADAGIDWIAVDWGTSTLRGWAMDANDAPMQSATAPTGMAELAPAEFEGALLALVDDWLAAGTCTPVVACGMAGARQGWAEADYLDVPCTPAPEPRGCARPKTADPRIDVRILPGLAQSTPADVMRGEETQLAGLLSAEPGFDGVACLPGTHSKWVRLECGTVREFRTCMTGELYGALARHTVLRHSVGVDGGHDGTDVGSDDDEARVDGDIEAGVRDDAFADAVRTMLADPASLTHRLFGLRAASLLNGESSARTRAALSGYLVGSELAAMRDWWTGADVVVVGSAGLADRYACALHAVQASCRCLDADALVLRGLAAARRALFPASEERT